MTQFYKISDFNEVDVKKAKKFLKSAFMGWLRVCLDEQIDNFFEKLSDTQFCGLDQFSLILEMNTIGNDLLAAIGCAINESEQCLESHEKKS